MTIAVKFFENQNLVAQAQLKTTLELGRQRQGEAGLGVVNFNSDGDRMVIASRDETNISRRHLVLELDESGNVFVENLNPHLPITLRQLTVDLPGAEDEDQATQTMIAPSTRARLRVPTMLLLGDKVLRLEETPESATKLSGLGHRTLAPGLTTKTLEPFHTLFAQSDGEDGGEAVLEWLHSAMGVFQQAASSPEFFADAARAVVNIVDLDAAGILFRTDNGWETRALAFSDSADEAAWNPSNTVLNRVVAENRVFRQLPEASNDQYASLMDVLAVVAAPILDTMGNVIGVIYGDRRQPPDSIEDVQISLLEAKLVELLASAVASGLARLTQEKAAVAARTQFEQFFSAELVRELERDETLLDGRDAEVTLLFMDIRGFSRITERLGPSTTLDWINDVLGRMSECVYAESGVLVEYIGDELFAMWGAPTPCEDQAKRACRAALKMIDAIPELDARWHQTTGEELRIGIGINTGVSRVGNVGSLQRFKYGPLGNAVNLASRLQGATKYLGQPLLISGDTASQLDDQFAARRLCTIRVNNIREPVEIYDVAREATPPWQQFQRNYHHALECFEKSEFPECIRILASLLSEHSDDKPSILLMTRAVDMMSQYEQTAFDPVWELPGK